MNNVRDSVWLTHLFRYQHQLRAGRLRINPSDLEVLTACAMVSLCGLRPSAGRIASESNRVFSDNAVADSLRKFANLGVLRPRGAGFTTGSHLTWPGYRPHAVDQPNVDRQVAEFIKDFDRRVADLLRRQPRKRLA
jgi:hypothetical protein